MNKTQRLKTARLRRKLAKGMVGMHQFGEWSSGKTKMVTAEARRRGFPVTLLKLAVKELAHQIEGLPTSKPRMALYKEPRPMEVRLVCYMTVNARSEAQAKEIAHRLMVDGKLSLIRVDDTEVVSV